MIANITQENLHLGYKAKNKAEVLTLLGEEFKKKGYVSENCTAFLDERERQVSTFLGNGITLPHLPKSATNIILKTGIEIFQFPDGVIDLDATHRDHTVLAANGRVAPQVGIKRVGVFGTLQPLRAGC